MTVQNGVASRTLRGVFYLGLSSVGTLVIGFGAGIILARLLTPTDFGWYVTAMTIFVFLDLRTRLVIEQRYVQLPGATPAMLHGLLTVNVVLAVTALTLVGVAAAIALAVDQVPVSIGLLIIGCTGLVDAVTISVRTHVEKQLAFRAFAVLNLLGQTTQFAVSIALAATGWGYLSLFIGLAAGSVVTMIGILVIIKPSLRPGTDRVLIGDLLRYGRSHGIVFGLFSIILTYADNLIVAVSNGTAALGFYDRAYRTASLPASLLSAVIQRVALPAYRSVETNPAQLTRAAGMSLWLVGIGAIPLATALFASAPEFIQLVYGDKWLPAAPFLQALLLFTITRPMYDNAVALLVAINRSSAMGRLSAVQALAVIGLGLPAGWLFGPGGVAVAIGIAFALGAAALYWVAKRDLGVALRHVLFVPAGLALLSIVALWLLSSLIGLDEIPLLPRFIIKVFCILLVFGTGIVLVSRNDALDRIRLLTRSFRAS